MGRLTQEVEDFVRKLASSVRATTDEDLERSVGEFENEIRQVCRLEINEDSALRSAARDVFNVCCVHGDDMSHAALAHLLILSSKVFADGVTRMPVYSSRDRSILVTIHCKAAQACEDAHMDSLALHLYEMSISCWSDWNPEESSIAATSKDVIINAAREFAHASMSAYFFLLWKIGRFSEAFSAGDHAIKHFQLSRASMFAKDVFNLAVKEYKSKEYRRAADALRIAVNAFEKHPGEVLYSENQEHSLRILSLCFLELNELGKAEAAIMSACNYGTRKETLLVHLKVLLCQNDMGRAEEACNSIISRSDATLEICTDALYMLQAKEGTDDIALRVIQVIEDRFENSTAILYAKAKTLCKSALFDEAYLLFEILVRQHNWTKSAGVTPPLHDIMMQAAVTLYSHNELEKSSKWLQLMEILLTRENFSELLSRVLTCHAFVLFEMQNFCESLNICNRAMQFKLSPFFAYFIAIRCMLALRSSCDSVLGLFQAMLTCEDIQDEYLILIYQDASSTSQWTICFLALEEVLAKDHTRLPKPIVVHHLSSIFSHLGQGESDSLDAIGGAEIMWNRMYQHIHDVTGHFCEKENQEMLTSSEYMAELEWIAASTWNFGIDCLNLGTAHCWSIDLGCSFFECAVRLFEVVESEVEPRSARHHEVRNNIDLALEAIMKASVEGAVDSYQKKDLEKANKLAAKALDTGESLKLRVKHRDACVAAPTNWSRYLLEFEAKALLNDSGAEDMVMKALNSGDAKAEYFEAMGQFLAETHIERPALLKAAGSAYLSHFEHTSSEQQERRCAWYRALITQSESDDDTVRFFSEAMSMPAASFDKTEAHWFVGLAWNEGVKFYRAESFHAARQWMQRSVTGYEKLFPAKISSRQLIDMRRSLRLVDQRIEMRERKSDEVLPG